MANLLHMLCKASVLCLHTDGDFHRKKLQYVANQNIIDSR